MALWLGAVLLGTGIAGFAGRLGVEPAASSASPRSANLLYRRVLHVCLERVVTFAVLNIAGTSTHCHRPLAPEADLPLRVLSDRRADLAAGCYGAAAAREGLDQR